MDSLRSPMDLCERLGLRPMAAQLSIMRRFYEGENPLQAPEVPNEKTVNAVAVCALWRLLSIPGSRCVVIGSSRDLEGRFMGILHEITTKVDPILASVCRWTNKRTLKVGDAAGHELRFVSNVPEWLRCMEEGPTTYVVLGARSSDTNFVDASRIIESYDGLRGARHIIVW